MKVDIIIPVYKTEDKICDLIDSIYMQNMDYNIIVCFTETNLSFVSFFKKEYPEVKVLYEKKRSGKIPSINKMLRFCSGDIVVLSSSDVVFSDNFLDKITNLFTSDIVAVCVHPVCKNPIGFVGKLYKSYWSIHHNLSLIKPKFGEVIAFRLLFNKLPLRTSADEELIASLLSGKGRFCYAADAFVYNSQPDSFFALFKQRYRYYAGHKELLKYNGYRSSALSFGSVFRSIFASNLFFLCFIVLIEISVRLLYLFYKQDSMVWTK